jgi:hypothetical protein
LFLEQRASLSSVAEKSIAEKGKEGTMGSGLALRVALGGAWERRGGVQRLEKPDSAGGSGLSGSAGNRPEKPVGTPREPSLKVKGVFL